MPIRKRKLSRYAGIVALTLIAGTGVYTYSGGDDAQNPLRIVGADVVVTLLLLDADQDFGRLPQYTGTWDTGDHCWEFDGSGTVVDDCGSWDLAANGSPRTGIVSGLPLDDGSGAVDWDGPTATWLDSSSSYWAKSAATYSAAAMSITALYHQTPADTNNYIMDHGRNSGDGVLFYSSGGRFRIIAEGTTATMQAYTDTGETTAQWTCITAVVDGTSSVIYKNGRTLSLTNAVDHGTIADTGTINVGQPQTGNSAGFARVRIKYSAISQADHLALCGSLWEPVRSDHPAVDDISWTQTGGARCFETAASRALCVPGGKAGYLYDDAYRWSPGCFPGGINRVLYSTAADCTDVTCATATIAASVAPDGSPTASSITMGGGTVDWSATGYGASAALYGRMWVKCSSGTLTIAHQGGTGSDTVDCSAVGGAWSLQTFAGWQATAGGALTVRLSGTDAEVWGLTWTEQQPYSTPSIIPTAAAAVDEGTATWTIDNTGNTYWQAGDTVTQDLTTVTGTCFVTGTTLRLSGTGGSECVGAWHSLEFKR